MSAIDETAIDRYDAGLDGALGTVAATLHEHIDAALDGLGLEARVYQSQPIWMRGKELLVGYKAFPRWVTFQIWNPPVDDPTGTLAAGPRMSTIKYSSVEQIDVDALDTWLAQVRARL